MKKKQIIIIVLAFIFCVAGILVFKSKKDVLYGNINNLEVQTNTNILDNNKIYENSTNINNNNNNLKDNLSTTEKIINNYEKAGNSIMAKVYNYEIKEKDLSITALFYKDSEDLLNQEIQDIVLEKLAIDNNITIDEREKEYINNEIEGLSKDIYYSDLFNETNISREEYLQLLKEHAERITLKNQYINLIREKIDNGTLEIENQELKKEYNDYYKKYEEWKETKDMNKYNSIFNLEEELLDKYISYKISQAEILIY